VRPYCYEEPVSQCGTDAETDPYCGSEFPLATKQLFVLWVVLGNLEKEVWVRMSWEKCHQTYIKKTGSRKNIPLKVCNFCTTKQNFKNYFKHFPHCPLVDQTGSPALNSQQRLIDKKKQTAFSASKTKLYTCSLESQLILKALEKIREQDSASTGNSVSKYVPVGLKRLQQICCKWSWIIM